MPLADLSIEADDLEAVAAVYRSGWLTTGPRTAAFERAFADVVERQEAVAVSSGTAALHLLLLAAGLGPGDEVIVPSLSFVATASAVAYTGAKPVFVDIESRTRPWLSAEASEAAVGPRTAAIVAMPYGGHPGSLPELAHVAGRHELILLEDAAHALGARVGERRVGAFGAGAAFSFFSNKPLAVGEGGMAVTARADWAAAMRSLRSHGMTSGTWTRHRGHASGYDVVALGFNYRIDEPRAALGLSRLGRLEDERRCRERLDVRYRTFLDAIAGVEPGLPATAPGEASAHHLFPAVLANHVDRDQVRRQLADRGIQTSVHYRPIHQMSLYAGEAPSLPVTEEYGRRMVTLPLFAAMTDAQQDLVVEELAGALDAAQAA